MGLKVLSRFMVICDRCDNCREAEFTPQEATRAAKKNGWRYRHDEWLCPVCEKKNEPKKNDPRKMIPDF